MRFDKFHPILAELIPTFEHQGVKCPACSSTMHHKVNYLGTLRWLECVGCNNRTTIFQTAGQEFYDDLEMEVQISEIRDPNKPWNSWVRFNFDCTRQELRAFTAPDPGIPDDFLFKCDLPKWESLKIDYVTKKIKIYLTFS